ncbi:MAG: AraC family transcriptional regulator, partial [Rikenellaceae bacterium]|nr:AraC family transcriptional regulator [Rikenellaceae bacterium]
PLPFNETEMQERILTEENPFLIRQTYFSLLRKRPFRLQGGAILFCVSGQAVLSLNLKEYTVRANMEMILNPDSMLMIRRADKDFRVIFFYFNRSIYEEAHRQIDPAFFHHIHHNPVYTHSLSTAEWAEHHFHVIQNIYEDWKNRYRTAILTNYLRNFLLNIYDKLQREKAEAAPDSYKRKEEIFHRFIDLIHTHCTRHREVEFYADKLCISKRYLASITRQITGQTPKYTINKRLIQEIKILLSFSDVPLSEIAETLCFPDQSYLGRYFKRYTGETLRAYRSRITSL